MSTQDSVSGHYLGEAGAAYQAGFDERAAFYRNAQVDLYFREHVKPGDTLLDFGCNDGLFLLSLDAAKRIGVEVNPAAIEAALENASQQNLPIELHQTVADVAENASDVAISNHALEHTLNPLAELKGVYRALKPGGRFILVLPFDNATGPIHKAWKPDDPDNHLFTWSPMNIGNLLTESGFEVEDASFRRIAVSARFKPFHRVTPLFRLACWAFAHYRRKGEVRVLARKPG